MSMGGWHHAGANVTARTTVPEGWIDPHEAQQIRIWGYEKWQELKRLQTAGKTRPGLAGEVAK